MTAMAGRPYVLSGPAGVGKSALIRKLMSEHPGTFGFTVSHTTRAPRPDEKHGVDYYFVQKPEMQVMIERKEFIEHVTYGDCQYGTSRQAVKDVLSGGRICLIDVDIQGAKSVKTVCADLKPIFVFVKAPSFEELERRLRTVCGPDDVVRRRLDMARAELTIYDSPDGKKMFDHCVCNDNIDRACSEMTQIMRPGIEWSANMRQQKLPTTNQQQQQQQPPVQITAPSPVLASTPQPQQASQQQLRQQPQQQQQPQQLQQAQQEQQKPPVPNMITPPVTAPAPQPAARATSPQNATATNNPKPIVTFTPTAPQQKPEQQPQQQQPQKPASPLPPSAQQSIPQAPPPAVVVPPPSSNAPAGVAQQPQPIKLPVASEIDNVKSPPSPTPPASAATTAPPAKTSVSPSRIAPPAPPTILVPLATLAAPARQSTEPPKSPTFNIPKPTKLQPDSQNMPRPASGHGIKVPLPINYEFPKTVVQAKAAAPPGGNEDAVGEQKQQSNLPTPGSAQEAKPLPTPPPAGCCGATSKKPPPRSQEASAAPRQADTNTEKPKQ